MSYGKRVAVILGAVIVGALFLLAASGVLTATAQTGPFRIHITGGAVVIGHGLACFVREGDAEGTAAATGSATGTFVANLKVPTTAAPCGTISGTVTFEADPHLAGFFGSFHGLVTGHAGPKPDGSFVGDFVNGSWQIQHVSGGQTPVAVGEGVLNVSK